MTARFAAASAVLALLVLAGCGTGRDAVATGGEFQFVAPGGQTTIHYDPPAQRGALRGLTGESLLEPGRMIGPDDFPGQVVVINIWGSWCGPCRTEMPELQRVYEQNRASGVAFLGIDVRDNRDAAADFLRDRGVAFPSIFDEPGRSLVALRGYPRNTVPSTIVLDRSHRVAAVFLTTVRVSELQPLLTWLAAEPAG
jgi:thiol-disulfide isomerase/thioredoxin